MAATLLKVEKNMLPFEFHPGQRRSEDLDEHDHAAEEDLQPSVYVPTHRGQPLLLIKGELRCHLDLGYV